MARLEWHEFIPMPDRCGFLRRSLECDFEPGDGVLRQLLRRAIAGEVMMLDGRQRRYMSIGGRRDKLYLSRRRGGFLERHDNLLNSLNAVMFGVRETEAILQDIGFDQIDLAVNEAGFRPQRRICSTYQVSDRDYEIY